MEVNLPRRSLHPPNEPYCTTRKPTPGRGRAKSSAGCLRTDPAGRKSQAKTPSCWTAKPGIAGIFPFQPYPWFTLQGDSDTENRRRSLLWLRSGVREVQEEDLVWPVGWQVDRPSCVVVRIIEAAAVFDATLWGTGCGEVKDEMDEGNAGKRIVDGDRVRRVGVTQFG